ncbi:MAG TPA: dTDP-4-dehydrorhamnose 3,5-epimerase family protein [Actinomycetota bacterium]|nr:dTDP-4-dehydrorhamnose 3,5-epimerase family protein [Actinomycetota bacterium]
MSPAIDGVWTKPLRVIPDERGRLMEILRADDEGFAKFGQVYLSTTYPGVVKAWHLHEVQDDNFCCVKGMVKLVLYDGRDTSATHGMVSEYHIGEHNPMLVRVPAGVLHGWKCTSTDEAFVINAPTEPYNYERPDELRVPWDSPDVPYDWDIVFK